MTGTTGVLLFTSGKVSHMHNADDDHFGALYWASSKKTGWHSHANGKTAKQVKLSDTTIYARFCHAVFLRRAEESADGSTA